MIKNLYYYHRLTSILIYYMMKGVVKYPFAIVDRRHIFYADFLYIKVNLL